MEERDDYRSKLRTPKKEIKTEPLLWGNTSPSYDHTALLGYSRFLNTPSPAKRRYLAASELPTSFSPHKSGYFLRTPSPFKQNQKSPLKIESSVKQEISGTPSPHKAVPSTDLFGNRSLLDNLPMPEWDEHFLDNFQEDLLFDIGSEDIEGLVRSPLKSPKRGHTFLNTNPVISPPSVSPFKSPLLTSSPKLSIDSPNNLLKTPGLTNGRPLTRQRKLFLQSPERQALSTSGSNNWPRSLPFSSLDDTSSSMFSDDHDTTTSIQSISTYLKNLDDEEHEDDYTVMPPIGWEASSISTNLEGRHSGKGKKKGLKQSETDSSGIFQKTQSAASLFSNVSSLPHARKSKAEPQFTLLRPHTELNSNQICLRLTTGTPPNKIKISRDFSQIQTLPSKEQLRIVRNRFRETLNKAVEQVMEKEKEKKSKDQAKLSDSTLKGALQRPALMQTGPLAPSSASYFLQGNNGRKPQPKKRKLCTT